MRHPLARRDTHAGQQEIGFHHFTQASIVRQVARFRPLGLFGLIYWYSVLPAHGIVFEREAENA